MDLKPDVTATSFSAQNGYFFANMSKLAYKTPDEVESTLSEMEDCKGLQDHFQWFQVLRGYCTESSGKPMPHERETTPDPTPRDYSPRRFDDPQPCWFQLVPTSSRDQLTVNQAQPYLFWLEHVMVHSCRASAIKPPRCSPERAGKRGLHLGNGERPHPRHRGLCRGQRRRPPGCVPRHPRAH